MKHKRMLATLLLALNACTSAPPRQGSPASEPTPANVAEALRRARDMHWTLQVYAADSIHAAGTPAMLGSSSAVLGGAEIPYAAMDSIYRWTPSASAFSKRSAVTGAVIVGGLGAVLSGLCYERTSCMAWLIGAGATVGTVLGASIGGILSPSEGEWEVFWRRQAG